jgi:DNA-binding transcriptional regulator GbsR (MarR family)
MGGELMPDGVRDEDGVRRFVEHMAMSWADWGFPRMPARVLMTLMAADEEALTAAELSERLGVSPAAISGGVRYLIQIGILQREPVPRSRRDRYRLPDDAWYQASTVKSDIFKMIVDITDGGMKAIGSEESPSAVRIREMRDFFAFMQAEMSTLMDKWHETRR